jgi:ABC-type sugar transport system, periplasmic component
MKKLALLMVVLMLIWIAAGCTNAPVTDTGTDVTEKGGSEVSSGGEMTGEGKTVGFSIASLAGNPFWQVMLDTLLEGFRNLGYEVTYTDAGGDVSVQMADVQNFIAMDVDVIIINPYDSTSIVDVTLEAKTAGIPVFAVDIPIDDTGYSIATFICDNWSLGYQLGYLGAGLFPDQNVSAIILSGYAGGQDSWDRRFGFVTGVSDYQIENYSSTGLDVLYQSYCNYEQELAYERMVDIITRFNGEFDIVFCENDAMALGVMTALEEANLNPSDYVILSIDGLKQAFEAVQAGTLYATGVNSPIDVAKLAVKYVDAYLNGDTSVTGTYFTEYAIVTDGNVAEYYDANSIY